MSASNSANVSSSDVRVSRQTQLLCPEMMYSNKFQCKSAPQSRAGSFKKTRRTETRNGARSSLPSLEDSILAKLEHLKQLEQDNFCVVRQFEASRHGIVNRGDSFRRHSRSTRTQVPSVINDTLPIEKCDESTTCDNVGSASQRQASVDNTRLVLIMGDHNVGKTALLQQFMTSEYMAALNTSFGEYIMQ